jgi:hypothetical protein
MIHTWKGKEIDTLSREELIEALNWFSREMQTLREDRNAWMKSGSAIQYMLRGSAIQHMLQNKGEMK